jgi:ribonuclease J
MRLMLNLTRPRYFLPVHGELRHLREHAKLAVQSGVPEENIFVLENGYTLIINKNGIRVGERVPGGYVFVDGSGVGDVGRAVIRDREILARDGFLLVDVNVDKDGKLIGEPEIISRGFIYLREADELMDMVKATVHSTLEQTRNSHNGKRRDQLQDSISKVLYNETKRRPMVYTIIHEQQ